MRHRGGRGFAHIFQIYIQTVEQLQNAGSHVLHTPVLLNVALKVPRILRPFHRICKVFTLLTTYLCEAMFSSATSTKIEPVV